MKALIKGQGLRIENHRCGTRDDNNWGDGTADIHLHKSTNRSIEGRRVKVVIKIPLNSNREIGISLERKGSREKRVEIPRMLRNEINEALSNREKLERFINDVDGAMRAYDSDACRRDEILRRSLIRIGEYFELVPDGSETISLSNGRIVALTLGCRMDDKSKTANFLTADLQQMFYVSITPLALFVGENSGYNTWVPRFPNEKKNGGRKLEH